MRLLFGLIPYGAVAIGLYALSSGWAAIGLYHLAAIAAMALAGYRQKDARLFSGWSAALGLPLAALCFGGCLLLYVLWPLIRLEGLALDRALLSLGLSGAAWWAFIPYYTLVNPVVEELFWRGFLGSDSTRPTLADVLFAGYHALVLATFMPWYVNAAEVLGLVFVAWIWRQLARRNGGLAIPLATHAAADLGIILASHLVAN